MEVDVAYFNSMRGVRIFSEEDGGKYLGVNDIFSIVDKSKTSSVSFYLKKVDEKWVKKVDGKCGKIWAINVRGLGELLNLFNTPKAKAFTSWFIESVVPTYIRPESQVEKAVQEVVIAEIVQPEKVETNVVEFIFPVTQAKIRTIVRDGEPWFVGKEICDELGIANSRDALSTLDDDEKITVANPDGNPRAGIPHTFVAINESGFYALVGKSRKPQAKVFKRWVNHDVLPAIRKDGMYVMGEEKVTTPESLEEMAIRVIQGLQEKVGRIMSEKKVLEGKTVELEKKADVYSEKAGRYDIALATDGMMIISVAAKIIGIPPRKMIPFLIEEDWIWANTKNGTIAKQPVINKGYMKNKLTTMQFGRIQQTQACITPLGLDKLMKLWAKKMEKSEMLAECIV